MKNFILAGLLFVGSVSFAQPTSGDILMDEVDTVTYAANVQQSQPAFEASIINAFKSGNAGKIAVYFGDNVDLSISGNTNLYSKSQATQILQHFFSEHAPKEFKIIHKGNSKTSEYFIGQLVAAEGKEYRVTLNVKSENNTRTITSLTIE